MGAEDFAALLQNSLTSGVMLAVAVIFALEKGQMLLVDDSIAQALLPARVWACFATAATLLSSQMISVTRHVLCLFTNQCTSYLNFCREPPILRTL